MNLAGLADRITVADVKNCVANFTSFDCNSSRIWRHITLLVVFPKFLLGYFLEMSPYREMSRKVSEALLNNFVNGRSDLSLDLAVCFHLKTKSCLKSTYFVQLIQFTRTNTLVNFLKITAVCWVLF